MEQKARAFLVEIMQVEDSKENQEPYLEGWHFMLSQPEFAQSDRMLSLMELVEKRSLLQVIVPDNMAQPQVSAPGVNPHGVQVIIGKENKFEAVQNCSVVVCRYGLPEEVYGTIAVVGPTRMPYSHTIPTVYYLSSVLSQLLGGLYGNRPGSGPSKS
jgi:heat-inducible transcriptional repressor